MDLEKSNTLTEIRKLIAEHNLDAYVIPRTDPHNSEILPQCDERLKFISSFSGSNGIGLITATEALMWTDSRYFLQAPQELQDGWKMMKMLRSEIQWPQWILKNVKEGGKVGVNPFLMNADSFKKHKKTFGDQNIELVNLEEDLVEKIWKDRPSQPKTPIFVLDVKYSGTPVEEKFKEIGNKLKATSKAPTYIVTSLEEIAWVLNLRGSDSECTPYFISYLILNFDKDFNTATGSLYILKEKITPEVEQYLKKLNIAVKEYSSILKDISSIQNKVYIDTSTANSALCETLPGSVEIAKSDPNIIDNLKGVKNATEIQGFVDCHIRDGAAVVAYFAWLENALNVEKRNDLDEYSASLKLDQLRYDQALNKGLSFPAISSIGPNAAVIHYVPKEGAAAKLNNTQIYLLDSGGQYLDGTTDTTRTTHFGTANDEEKDAYTRVLLGNLDVERVVFPNDGTYSGADIDVLARRHLWEAGLNYGHGTGHGVGHFLNVHEGPHGISKHRKIPFQVGMIVTNEPGYYKDGSFGIRIENILVVEKKGEGDFLRFKNVTIVPYERELIDLSLLSQADVDFIDTYHKQVYDTLAPIFKEKNDNISLGYLERKTAKLQQK